MPGQGRLCRPLESEGSYRGFLVRGCRGPRRRLVGPAWLLTPLSVFVSRIQLSVQWHRKFRCGEVLFKCTCGLKWKLQAYRRKALCFLLVSCRDRWPQGLMAKLFCFPWVSLSGSFLLGPHLNTGATWSALLAFANPGLPPLLGALCLCGTRGHCFGSRSQGLIQSAWGPCSHCHD